MRARLISSLVLFALTAFVAAGLIAAPTLPTQSSNADGVAIKATPRPLPDGAWEFEIVFDTHTQPLSDDLMKTALLLANGKSTSPVAWQGDPPGGHHRKGVLRFDSAGSTRALELVLMRPGEPKPRSFRWQLK